MTTTKNKKIVYVSERLCYTHEWYPIIKKNQGMIKSKKGGKDQESLQPITTPDPEYHMRK